LVNLEHVGLRYLCCPGCEGPLRYRRSEMHPQESLVCGNCDSDFPLIAGVPRFVAAEAYTDSFGFQWNRHARTQLDSYTKLPISAARLQAATGWLDRLVGETILEAGSGAGRFTEVLVQTGATVLSFDYSTAVDANAHNNGCASNLILFQGDIFSIPCPPKSIDKVLCLGVLQHTPDPARAFRSLASRVKAGGQLVIDVYAKSLASRLHWRFLLRRFTKRMKRERLYALVERWTPPLIPVSSRARKLFGRFGSRLLPISEFSHLGLPPHINRDWAILDTFDMLSPEFDLPQSHATVRSWFESEGFRNVEVFRGLNGIVARGIAP
jgi:SAM-dependent methyltransferase